MQTVTTQGETSCTKNLSSQEIWGSDPEMRYAPSGDAVTSMNVATNRKYTDKSGQQVEGDDVVSRVGVGQGG